MKFVIRCIFVLAVLGACANAKTSIVLSTDVGNEVDDQWAIVYLLTNPAFETLGISSAHAPTLPSPSAHFTYNVLLDEVEHHLGMQVHPPLLEGSSEPLLDLKTPQPSAAADFLVRTSKAFSDENRLNVLAIGAATDVASAILMDPSIVTRINVIAMGFKNLSVDGGREFNIENDPKAWQVILGSAVPVTIDSADVCRADLALTYQQAGTLLKGHGPIAEWLWSQYQVWYFKNVKPQRTNDFTKPWIIWDIITLAHLEHLTKAREITRPALGGDLALKESGFGSATWIEKVDSEKLWQEFLAYLDNYTQTHALPRFEE